MEKVYMFCRVLSLLLAILSSVHNGECVCCGFGYEIFTLSSFLMACVIVNHNGFGHFGVRLLDFVGFDFEQSPESVAKQLATDFTT